MVYAMMKLSPRSILFLRKRYFGGDGRPSRHCFDLRVCSALHFKEWIALAAFPSAILACLYPTRCFGGFGFLFGLFPLHGLFS